MTNLLRLVSFIRLGCAAFSVWLPASSSATEAIPAYIAAAVANPARPSADRERDANRRPAEVIAFAGIEPGDKVADFMPGGGYFTRILCNVVGDSGHVYAISVPRTAATKPATTDSEPAVQPAEPQPDAFCANVTASTLQNQRRPAPELWSASDDPGSVYEYWSFTAAAELFAAPEPLDAIWTAENYHDLHNRRFGSPNLLAVDTALFNALKPGGILIVEDHAAAKRAGRRDTETLHRIERAQVKKELTAAGFVFVDESKVLRNSQDRHTVKAHDMHDRTDRFLLKFRKP